VSTVGVQDRAVERAQGSTFEDLERRLVAELGPAVPPSVVHDCIEDAAAPFAAAPIQIYVPLFVERRVRRVLAGRRPERPLG